MGQAARAVRMDAVGLFYVVDSADLAKSVAGLIKGKSAPQ